MNSTFMIPPLGDPPALFARFRLRIWEQCAAVEKLGGRLHDVGMDAVACDAATAIMHFFDHDAPLHHEDNELILFPMLRALKIDTDEKAHFDQVMQILTRPITAINCLDAAPVLESWQRIHQFI